jgi:phage baseplate assembly protein W
MGLEVRTYKDLDLNFRAHPVTKDVVKRTGDSAITTALRNLILTNRFEKPFQPFFGSRVRGLLFENVSFIVANLLQTEIEQTIRTFEPRVTLDSVRVQANNEENGYSVAIKFFINNVENPQSINLFLEKIQ